MLYNSKAFATVIGRLRVKKGLTQDGASALAGLSRSHWAELESGSCIPRLDTLWGIAYALGIKAHELTALVEKEMEEDMG